MEKLKLGKIVNTRGLKGEIKILLNPLYYDIEFKKQALIEIGEKELVLSSYKKEKNILFMFLVNYTDINDVLKFKGESIIITSKELKKKPADLFYSYQLLHLVVLDQFKENIGIVIAVEDTGWQKILRIKRPDGTHVLVPWVMAFVKDISLKNNEIIIETIEGLL